MSSDAHATAAKPVDVGPVPLDFLPGLKQNFKFDIVSGIVLFLVALPLSLAIAIASGAPAVAGVLSAMVGGMLGSMLSGSYITINGPAAGLIVIIAGAVTELGALNPAGLAADPMLGFKYALAVGVGMGVVQIILGLIKAGSMTNVFPFSVVEGMVAGIGVIILTKQLHVALGVHPESGLHLHGMMEVVASIPHSLANMDPHSAIIGAIAIALMIIWPKFKMLAKFIPAPLAIMVVTIPLAAHYAMSAKQLVHVPLKFSDSFLFPDFSMIFNPVSIQYIIAFVIVGSLESLLTAAAIEKKDPWKRRNNMDREFWCKGVTNAVSSFIGGIPMIAEVVRSSTNIMVGARTRWSNFFHGFFMLAFVAGLPWLLNMIPLAALAGMLVVIGYRLAHPNIFVHIAHTGKDELVFMVVTVFGVVLVNLLFGVFIGMWLSVVVNAVRAGNQNRFKSVPVFLFLHTALLGVVLYCIFVKENELVAIGFMMVSVAFAIVGFKTKFEVKESGDTVTIPFDGPVVYTSLIGVRNMMNKLPGGKKVEFDFTNAGLVDHTVREKINDFTEEYVRETGGTVTVTGTQNHTATCHHELATLVRA